MNENTSDSPKHPVNPSTIVLLDGQAITHRQWQVLQLQAQGLTYKEIADRLAISESTVKNHLANIRERLDAHSAIQLINKVFPREPGEESRPGEADAGRKGLR